FGSQPFSLGIAVGAANIATTCNGSTASNLNPQIMWDFGGGVQSSTVNARNCMHQPLQFDHWYDILLHIKWATDNTGLFEVTIDGTKYTNVTQPTLFTTASGTVDVPNLDLDNYRWMGVV